MRKVKAQIDVLYFSTYQKKEKDEENKFIMIENLVL